MELCDPAKRPTQPLPPTPRGKSLLDKKCHPPPRGGTSKSNRPPGPYYSQSRNTSGVLALRTFFSNYVPVLLVRTILKNGWARSSRGQDTAPTTVNPVFPVGNHGDQVDAWVKRTRPNLCQAEAARRIIESSALRSSSGRAMGATRPGAIRV